MDGAMEGKSGCDVTTPVTCIADPSSKSNLNSPHHRNFESSHFSGWTPLQRACRYGQCDVVAQLLSTGADPTELDKLGWSCAPLAVASGNTAVLKEILKALKWNRKDLAPALCLAALDGFYEAAEILLASRANVNEPVQDSGITPLMLAAGEGRADMVALLLEHGADPDMTNALHQTALDAAVVRNHGAVQAILGPLTHLRSKISAHIPLPVSPPNRALQSPSSSAFRADLEARCLAACSPFMGHFHNPSPMTSPMQSLPCMSMGLPSPMCASLCVPSGTLVARGCMSPSPASYPSLSPFHLRRMASPAAPCPGFYQNQNAFLNIPNQGIPVPTLNSKAVTKGNTRLRKWWCQMKKRCKGDKGEFLGEEKSQDVAMEKRFANFLRSIKMMEYQQLFKSQEVDFETFLTLTEEDLEEIGVKNPAHRSKIVEKIEKFTQNASKF